MSLIACIGALFVTPTPAHAGTAGYQWASCSSGGRSFSARLYWNSSGYEYALDFKSPHARVKQVDLRGVTSLEPMWMNVERFTSFPRSTSYSRRSVYSRWPWGWHRHWSGSTVLYQSALTVYVADGNWTPDCTIHFYEQSNRF